MANCEISFFDKFVFTHNMSFTMENNILFSEKQYFRQWWLWLIILGIDGLFIYGFTQQIILGKPFGDRPLSNAGLFVFLLVCIGITWLFLSIRLETFIKKDGIYVRLFPFHAALKHYHWDQLQKVYVRQYAPIKEYGGWGLRSGWGGKNHAYNISGDMGLQLEFSDGKKLLIGTSKPEQLTACLNTLQQ